MADAAFACVFLVILLDFLNNLIPAHRILVLPEERIFNFAVWAGILAVTGYAMGTLYEAHAKHDGGYA